MGCFGCWGVFCHVGFIGWFLLGVVVVGSDVLVMDGFVVEREVFRADDYNVRQVVRVKVGSFVGVDGFVRFVVELEGPFSLATRGVGDELFGALQVARRWFEPHGWLLAVEGSRLCSRPSGMLRDQAGGLVVYRLDGVEVDAGVGLNLSEFPAGSVGLPFPVRNVLDVVDVSECVTVVEQERWFEGWVSGGFPKHVQPVVVSGRGWYLVCADLGKGRVLFQPVFEGEPYDGYDSFGVKVPVLFTDRFVALGRSYGEPLRVRVDELVGKVGVKFVVDQGQLWETVHFPKVLKGLPKVRLGELVVGDSRFVGLFPVGSRVFTNLVVGGSFVVVLPVGSDLDVVAVELANEVGAALVPMLVLVVEGLEPRRVKRALKKVGV